MVHLAQENSAGHLERLVSRYEPVPEPGLEGLLVIKALQAVARPLAEERQEAWQAKQKARMQAVARKLLQRNGTSTQARTRSRKAGCGRLILLWAQQGVQAPERLQKTVPGKPYRTILNAALNVARTDLLLEIGLVDRFPLWLLLMFSIDHARIKL